MSLQTDTIRAQAASLTAIAATLIAAANAIDGQAPPDPPPTQPNAVDCLSGAPPAVSMLPAEQDMNLYHTRKALFNGQMPGTPSGTILYIGDSITQYMAVPANSFNAGISGDTMRGVLNRIDNNLIHRCGAVVILIGINDLVWETGMYGASQAIADVKYMWDLLAPKMQGRWVVVKPLPINETIYTNTNGKNANIKAVGDYIEAKFASSPHVAVVDAWGALAPSGQLEPAYTPSGDGVHLSAAGYAVLLPLIRSALDSLGAPK